MRHVVQAIGIALVVAVGPVVPAAPAGGEPAGGGKELREAIEGFSDFYRTGLEKARIVGSSFVLVHDNEVVHREHHGHADLERNRVADDDTIYHWASITKTLTGIAILQLRDRGLLDLDDPVVEYVPEIRAVRNVHGSTRDITIRHLLTHTAGFRGPTWPWKSEEWHPHEPTRWDQIVAMLPYTEVRFEPGTRWSYSNLGVVFLGQVIERISGDDYEVYVDKNILKPLGMHRSYFDATPYHLLEHRARSYWIRAGTIVPARFDVDTGITVSNGGLNAPVSDFLRYVNFLMGDPDLRETHDGVLRRESLEEMWLPVIEIPGRGDEGDVERRDFMGLAFFLEENRGTRFVGHSGGQNAFVTHFYLCPESRTAYIVAYNTRTDTSIGERDHARDTTSELDGRIKNHLFEHVFPLFEGS
jgi:CubicO group peptidase (beta-lactamase class C family)